jgi:hypothetical protein
VRECRGPLSCQYTLSSNEENKLAEVELDGFTQAPYTYDGDGTLVERVVDGRGLDAFIIDCGGGSGIRWW